MIIRGDAATSAAISSKLGHRLAAPLLARPSTMRIKLDNTIDYYSYICGNKMPTRCNRGFYCRSYCLLNIFRAPLRPSSGAQEYYTVVAACGIWCCGFQVSTKYHRQQPLYNILKLLMMGIVVPETC